MGRDTIQLEDAVSTISQEYLLEFTSEYGIPESLHPELPGLEDTIVDFLEGKVGVYTKKFEFENFCIPISQLLFDILGHYQIYLSQLSVIGEAKVSHFEINYRVLNIVPTLNLFRVFYVPSFNSGWMSFSKRSGKNTPQNGRHGRALGSSGIPASIEKSPLDFADENPPPLITERVDISTAEVIPKASLEKEVTAMGHVVNKRCHKRGNEGTEANAPPKVLRKDHIASCPSQSKLGGKSLATIAIEAVSAVPTPATQETPVSDPGPLSYAKPWPTPKQDIAQRCQSQKILILRSPPHLHPWLGHLELYISRGYFSELRHLPQDNFLSRYNINLAQQVAIGSQFRLRYEQEAKPLKKAIAQVAQRDQRIGAREKHIKNLEVLLEAEADMKKAAEANNAQVTREERIKATFEEFKKYEDDNLEKSCAEMDARLDALSIDVDEELYPHMLIAIAGRRWVIGHGLRLTVMKCAESLELRQAFSNVVSAGIVKGISKGLEYGVKQREAKLDLAAIEAYDPDADDKYVAALHALKDLKYPLVDQLEKLKDIPLDLIMASLYLESDTGEDAPQWIRDLRTSSSQFTIPVYPEVRDPKDPWACKEEILLGDAIATNISHAEKKKKCRVVCRTHRVGSAHHARSDGVPVSAPTVAPQGLVVLLADTTT
ncbi:hypothetical protein Tco_0953988 [Tanacetum coccineum]|uniref:Transposase (Putative), gypsy type n=1 Tax=Tanacetum coccineum TaxID=301880 RepID=A0ABQ5E349_9ASTR